MFFNRHESFRIRSGEHHTVNWWQRKADFDSIHKTAFRLNKLTNEKVVEKIYTSDEIVRYIPTAMFSENDVIKMLQK